MSSFYDEEPHTTTGRASVPGSSADPDGLAGESYEPIAEPLWSSPAADRPSPTGRSTVGRASVRSAVLAPEDDFDPFDESPSATISGRASVPMPTGPMPAGPMPGGPSTTGRATVGRATVAPARTAPPGDGMPGGPDGPGPQGPDAGDRPPAKGPSKKTKRRRRLLYALAALIMLIGFGIMGITYYSSTIPTPEAVPLPQATTLYYSDGKTVLAQIGTVNRKIITDEQLKPWVKQAVIATEDETFYSNIGVDVKGIARAFVNNLTGGEQQGGSTITQQYARSIVKDYDASYTRKAREVILAIKMNQNLTKEQILLGYLNTVDFGRGAYGIEAAAEAYFGKTAATLTPAQAMVLAGLIKSPESGIYSPTCQDSPKTPAPCAAATGRFEYTKSQMMKVTGPDFLPPDQVSQLVYPAGKDAATKWTGNQAEQAIKGPNGFIIHQVMSELSALKKPDGSYVFPRDNTDPDGLLNGGYQITTTIDKNAQAAAVKYASKASPDAPVHKFVKGIGAALVAVQPGTGNVLAYYGGDDGTGIDYAGVWDDPVTSTPGLSGGHIKPGSNFKTVTMATALSTGMSVKSMWYGPDVRDFKQRGAAGPVHNASKGDDCGTKNNYCTMQQGLAKSLNTMYYAIGTDTKAGMNPGKIVNMAYNLGIKHIWGGDACGNSRVDLDGKNGVEYTENRCIGAEVSFGQFGVALQDMANVMATYANHGVKASEHFVKAVSRGFGKSKETLKLAAVTLNKVPDYSDAQNNDLTWSMESVFKNSDERDNQLAGDRPAAVKTGTWELGEGKNPSANGTLMFSGFTAGDAASGQIAVSVWIGNNGSNLVKGKPVDVALATTDHSSTASSGPPADTFQKFVDAYEANGPGGKPWPIKYFTDPSFTGDPNIDDPRPSPTPSVTPTPSGGQPGCGLPLLCPSTGPSNGGGPGGGGGGGGGGGNGDTEPPGAPGGLNATLVGGALPSVGLSWQASGDNVGVVEYRIYRNGRVIGQSTDTSYTDKTIRTGRTYNYTVTAVDAAHNESATSNTAQVST